MTTFSEAFNLEHDTSRGSIMQAIRGARLVLLTPDRWTQGAAARAADGLELESGADRRAVCWCLASAISLARDKMGLHRHVFWDTCNALGYDGPDLTSWNDDPDRTYEEVMDKLNETFLRLENWKD